VTNPNRFERHPKITLALITLIPILLLFLAAEIYLRITTNYPVHSKEWRKTTSLQQDPILGHTLHPDHRESDQEGFRNPHNAPKHPDVIMIGDSHTYGNSILREQNWPHQYAQRTGQSYYNYGMGGYGFLQYYATFQKALQKHPKRIILGLYVLNDFRDTTELLGLLPHWQTWAKTHGFNAASRSSCFVDRSIDERSRLLFIEGFGEATQGFLIQNSALFSMVKRKIERATTPRYLKDNLSITAHQTTTLLPKHNLGILKAWTDQSSPCIQEGFDVLAWMLPRMRSQAQAAGVAFHVLIIPSKPTVMAPYHDTSHHLSPLLKEAIANESALTEKTEALLKTLKIPHINALPFLQEALKHHPKIYDVDWNFHPLQSGYEAYAKAVMALDQHLMEEK